jgi:molybdopterin-guanine dinucleotide biosynthesis protein A
MILGAILAGGQGRRFGRDKALARWRGAPLIDHVAAQLRPRIDRLVVCGRQHGAIVALQDRPEPGIGPLGGLSAALAYALSHGYERVISAPCDTPSIDGALIDALLAHPGPAIVADCPVVGVWPSQLSEALDRFLASATNRAVRSWAEAAGAVALPLAAPMNINSPEDLAALHD